MRRNGLHTSAVIVFSLLALCCLLPMLLLFSASITDNNTIILNGYRFIPEQTSLAAYRYLWSNRVSILHSYLVSIGVTLVGTALGLSLSLLLAYPLSRKDFAGRKFLAFFVFFTMLFNGGMVPSYLLYSRILGMKNTYMGLIVPHLLINAFNVIILRTFISSNIPQAIIESGKIDGANEFSILIRLVVPMSTPILATVGLLIGISYWNDWYNGTMYATKNQFYSAQCLLNKMMKDIQFLAQSGASGTQVAGMQGSMPTHTVRMAIATIVVIPIMAIFPFFQKYFTRGITLGSVKG